MISIFILLILNFLAIIADYIFFVLLRWLSHIPGAGSTEIWFNKPGHALKRSSSLPPIYFSSRFTPRAIVTMRAELQATLARARTLDTMTMPPKMPNSPHRKSRAPNTQKASQRHACLSGSPSRKSLGTLLSYMPHQRFMVAATFCFDLPRALRRHRHGRWNFTMYARARHQLSFAWRVVSRYIVRGAWLMSTKLPPMMIVFSLLPQLFRFTRHAIRIFPDNARK